MNKNLRKRAQALADRSYSVQVNRDETTNGEAIFLLTHPELPGCMAQGATIEEAQANLDDARMEYILSLLEEELPVPDPVKTATITASAGHATLITGRATGTKESAKHLSDLEREARPLSPQKLFEVLPQT